MTEGHQLVGGCPCRWLHLQFMTMSAEFTAALTSPAARGVGRQREWGCGSEPRPPVSQTPLSICPPAHTACGPGQHPLLRGPPRHLGADDQWQPHLLHHL